MTEYAQTLIDDLNEALKRFGTYTYHDKGAWEVMDIDTHADYLETKSIKEVAAILTDVLDNHDNAENLVEALIHSMDDRDDFDELFDFDDRFVY